MSELSDRVAKLEVEAVATRRQNYYPAIARKRDQEIERAVDRAGRRRYTVTLPTMTVASSGAPADADYLVKTASGSLSAERVVTDSPTVSWDWGSAGVAKAYLKWTVVTKTGTYSATYGDFVNANVTSGSFSVTLPTAVGHSGESVRVRRTDASGNTLTVDTTGGQTINGAGSVTLPTQFECHEYESDGANWMKVF